MFCGVLLIAVISSSAPETRADDAMQKGVAYLLANQAADGSWGKTEGVPKSIPGQAHPVFNKPEWITVYRIAGSCLVYQALLRAADVQEPAVTEALAKAEAFLLKTLSPYPPRDPNKVFDRSVWVNVYGLAALSDMRRRYAGDATGRMAATAIEARLKAIAATQLGDGGWHYANIPGVAKAVFNPRAKLPPFGASASTSFLTALHVLALRDARAQGVKIDPALLDRAGKVLLALKSEQGGFLYSNRRKALPRPNNRLKDYGIRGSMGRLALCTLALADLGLLEPKELHAAVEQFIQHHLLLDRVYGKGGSHYPKLHNNASYYWLFGYCYTAELARRLADSAGGKKLRATLVSKLLSKQKPDGSWLDCPNLGKAYGTAMAVLALSDKPLFQRPAPATQQSAQ